MLRFQKVFITGAKGTLGTELREQLDKYGLPYVGTDKEVDICNYSVLWRALLESKCDCLIHCAGLIDVPWCETHRDVAYKVNVVGTMNVVRACRELDKFMLLVNTDYVYRGDKPYTGDGKEGNYEIGDHLDPINFYAYTKVLADIAVQSALPESSVITRLSFKKKGPWPYPKAFIDQYTSRDTVDVIANQILQVLYGYYVGIVHLGTERKTVYELAKRQSPEVEPISIHDLKNVVLPHDTSLKLTEIEEVL
jgi:dTDP-4-dehydrorhamnose reductase